MTVDREKIRQKLHFIRSELRELHRLQRMSEGEFKKNSIYPAAAARMLQVTIEAMLDICAHIVSREGWGLPKSYREAVILAAEHGIIPKDMQDTYEQMARFRNRLVHLYDTVDAAEIWNIVQNNLGDLGPFVSEVVKRYLPPE